jgi:hypothetical protein
MPDTTPLPQITRNISLDADTDAIVAAHDDLLGLKNYSAAIRVIVREWKRLKDEMYSVKTRSPRNNKSKAKA